MANTAILQHPATVWPYRPLIDQIQLRHGPVQQLGRFFLVADQAAYELGVRLQLHTDMASFNAAYQSVQMGRPVSIFPVFDPRHNDLSAANAFWISGHDETGQVVATQAARFFDMTNTTVERELNSFRLLYADPAPAIAAGARIRVDCPPASTITGRVIFSGGAWYHRKVRGLGLSQIMPRISRALAYTQWNTACTFGLVEEALITKQVHRSYGYVRHSPSVKLANSYREDMDFEMVWMPRDEMLADLADYAARVKAERTEETTETNALEPLRQGSSMRS
jgi:hypothetical protein